MVDPRGGSLSYEKGTSVEPSSPTWPFGVSRWCLPLHDRLWERYHERKRCSRDTYSQSNIPSTLVHEDQISLSPMHYVEGFDTSLNLPSQDSTLIFQIQSS